MGLPPPLSTWAAHLQIDSRADLRRLALGVGVFILALGLLGRSSPDWLEARDQRIGAIVGPWQFDLIAWEIDAVSEKLVNALNQPAAGLTIEEDTALVKRYIEDARALGSLERQINGLLATDSPDARDEIQMLQRQVDALREEQQARRPAVESIIQQQVGRELAAAGFQVGSGPFPPVWFTFVEPPKKLVVSPRERIATVYSSMLTEEISPTQIEADEAAIAESTNLSAYITNIGGLGAYPTMVIDRASLPWIFNTVAHEWAHNYLTLFPLGLRYNVSGELITINETVAEIVGDTIGERVVARYYPEFLPQEEMRSERLPINTSDIPQPFNFRREMRETRLRVDALLAAGFVETAEYYMEARRQYFVANGYGLRVLNQAYFAFHGSYGTSPASTSPIGPKLQALYARSGDLADFLRAVRWFTGTEDIESALAQTAE
ncbi:hypothetical protein GC175_03415 [bacterium]|nr:hypothetical protein [bacterium]